MSSANEEVWSLLSDVEEDWRPSDMLKLGSRGFTTRTTIKALVMVKDCCSARGREVEVEVVMNIVMNIVDVDHKSQRANSDL